MTEITATASAGRRRAASTPEDAQHELIVNWISDDGQDAVPTIQALYPHVPVERIQLLVDDVIVHLRNAHTLEDDGPGALPLLYDEHGDHRQVQFRLDKELADADELVADFISIARATDPQAVA